MLGLLIIAAVNWVKDTAARLQRAFRPIAAAAVLRLAPVPPPAPIRTLLIPPKPLTPEEHWHRAVSVVRDGLFRFERIRDLTALAADELDVAGYAMELMLGELATAMPLPANGAPLRALVEAEAARPVDRAATRKQARPGKKRLAA